MVRSALELGTVLLRGAVVVTALLAAGWAAGILGRAKADAYLVEQRDQVDGAVTYTIGIVDGRARLFPRPPAMLVYRCSVSGLIYVGLQIERENYFDWGETVRFRIDGGPVQEVDVPQLAERDIVEQLKRGSVLDLKLADGQQSYRFTLSGVTKAFRTIESQCPLP